MPTLNSVKLMKARDRQLSMVGVAEEQAVIMKTRFHNFEKQSLKKREKYIEWCKENNIDSLIQ